MVAIRGKSPPDPCGSCRYQQLDRVPGCLLGILQWMPAPKESEIQAAILDYLALRGHFCFRLNNIPAVYIDRHGARQFRKLPKYTMKGIPDIVLIHNGRFYGIECKSE